MIRSLKKVSYLFCISKIKYDIRIMETTIKVLCTAQEAFALIDLLPRESFIQLVQNDPTYGWNGSGEFYVVYIDNSNYYFSHSRLFNLGMQVQQKIGNK